MAFRPKFSKLERNNKMASSTLRIPLSARVQGATSTHASGNTKALINSFVGKSDALAGALDVSSPRFSPLPPLSDGVTPAVSLMHLPLISSSKRRTTLRQTCRRTPISIASQ